MKKIILVFILIFSLSFFYGCNGKDFALEGQFILAQMEFFSDGKIVQTFGVSVGSEMQDDYSQKEQTEFKKNLLSQMDVLREKFILSFAITYLQSPQEEFKFGRGVTVSQTAYSEENDMMFFEIIFSSLPAWNYYHSLETEGQEESQGVPLFAKKQNISSFPFAVEDSSGKMLGESYKQIYLSALSGFSFEEELTQNYNPKFVYVYSTYFSKIKSNADAVVEKNGQYYHIWQEDDLQSSAQVEIYYYIFNRGFWIMLALLVPSAGLGVWLLWFFLAQKRKKNKLK